MRRSGDKQDVQYAAGAWMRRSGDVKQTDDVDIGKYRRKYCEYFPVNSTALYLLLMFPPELTYI
jgi:hypothetical protein